MTSPRTPRQWAEGDTIPADVTAVHHHHEPLLDECGTQCAWIRRASDWKGPWGYALEEAEMLRRMGPVTEVIEDAPLSEVLPETPEPPQLGPVLRRCPNDDFPIRDETAGCPRCKRPGAASQSVPAVPVSSTGGKETGEAAETATEALSGEDRPGHGGDPARRAQLAEERLAEVTGWCKEARTAATQGVRVIDDIRAVLDEADRDCRIPGGLPIDEMPAPAVYFDRIRAILDAIPPLPDSDTEWEWGCGSSLDEVFGFSEETAREGAGTTGVLRKRRPAGPWIEVTS